MIFANYHTHTTFCDGRDTPEQLVQEALRLGCPAIGFSGHSIAPYDYAGMTPEHEAQYRAEVRRLQAACAGQIRILCGVEQDYWSEASMDGYDYVIGGVHYLRRGSEFRSVDGTPTILRSIVDDWFGGDWYAMAEEYYRLVGNLYEKTRCRVIAHFDLIEKFNEDGSLFDRNAPRYPAACQGKRRDHRNRQPQSQAESYESPRRIRHQPEKSMVGLRRGLRSGRGRACLRKRGRGAAGQP